jgi:S-adenosylmethionine/arginine decarboxylase-like enzyme
MVVTEEFRTAAWSLAGWQAAMNLLWIRLSVSTWPHSQRSELEVFNCKTSKSAICFGLTVIRLQAKYQAGYRRYRFLYDGHV